MKHPMRGFDFYCPSCGKVQSGEGRYEEDKIYKCLACKWKGMVPTKNKMYDVTYHPFTFLCPHCDDIQRTYDYNFKGDIDGYYITECNCPGCKKHLIFKTETSTHYFINQLKAKEERAYEKYEHGKVSKDSPSGYEHSTYGSRILCSKF